jgi:hypothetical protein
MSIVEKFKQIGKEVKKTDHFYRGIYHTEAGVGTSRLESECDDGIYFLTVDGSNVFPANDFEAYIISGTEYEGKKLSKEEAQQLASEGKIFSFKCSDLYAEVYDFAHNKDLESCFKYGYSARSRKYIEEVMENIGLLRIAIDDWVRNAEEICKYYVSKYDGSHICKLDDNTWVAVTSCGYIDDPGEIDMYFNRMPTEEEVRTAFDIYAFDLEPIEVFYNFGVKGHMNWLDFDGSIHEKYKAAKSRYEGY